MLSVWASLLRLLVITNVNPDIRSLFCPQEAPTVVLHDLPVRGEFRQPLPTDGAQADPGALSEAVPALCERDQIRTRVLRARTNHSPEKVQGSTEPTCDER